MISTQYVKLNMVPNGIPPVLYCSQYDVGRPLGLVVYNGSDVVDLSTYTATIEATRTDRTPITAAVTTDGNIGVFNTTATMTNKLDRYGAKLVLSDSNGNRVASLVFFMVITLKTMDENAEGIQEDQSLYQQYTATVQTIIAQIRSDLVAEANARQAADQTLQQNINAEASARQSADNTLQSNINAEASTRATQDASLQSQIDQLVAPSGEAPSAAEVENARIGSDGTVYPTLGDAIRTQNSLLKSQLEETQPFRTGNLITNLTDGYVVSAGNGNLVATSGWLVTDYLPLRPGIPYYHSGLSITSYAFYDINHKFIDLRQIASVATANKLNDPFTLPGGVFYGRFASNANDTAWAAMSSGERVFTPYSVDGRLADISQKAFDGQNAQLAGILKSGKTETLSADMYQHGSLDLNAAGAPLSVYHFSQRIVSVYKEQYPFDVKFTPDSGYGIHYVIFNDDGTITKSGSTFTTNALTVPKYSKFKLSVNAPANATVEDIASHVTISYVADAATDVDGVPIYYFSNDYLPVKIDTIVDKSPLDGLQFAFLTDVHCRENAGNSPELIRYIKSRTNSVPFVVFGGDVLISTVPEGVGVLDDAKTWQTWMEKMDKSHVYQVQGNHDYLGYHYVNSERVGFYEPLGVCRQFIIGNLEDVNVVGVPGKLWYYLDIPTAKTRIIILNDYDTPRNDVAFYGYNGMSVDQVRWVVENALDTDGIRVIFVSHQTYDTEMQGENQNVFVGMQSLFTAIANHTAYSYGAIQKDFTNSTIEFVAHICGHMHADASNVNNGVLTIQSTCDAYYGRSESVGTVSEQAFDIVTVDYTNSKLYTTRIGSGSDREFTI